MPGAGISPGQFSPCSPRTQPARSGGASSFRSPGHGHSASGRPPGSLCLSGHLRLQEDLTRTPVSSRQMHVAGAPMGSGCPQGPTRSTEAGKHEAGPPGGRSPAASTESQCRPHTPTPTTAQEGEGTLLTATTSWLLASGFPLPTPGLPCCDPSSSGASSPPTSQTQCWGLWRAAPPGGRRGRAGGDLTRKGPDMPHLSLAVVSGLPVHLFSQGHSGTFSGPRGGVPG